MSGFGRKIKAFREKHNLTQQQFADKAGWQVDIMGKIENGRIKPPREIVTDIHHGFPAMSIREWQDLLQSKASTLKEI